MFVIVTEWIPVTLTRIYNDNNSNDQLVLFQYLKRELIDFRPAYLNQKKSETLRHLTKSPLILMAKNIENRNRSCVLPYSLQAEPDPMPQIRYHLIRQRQPTSSSM